MADIQSGGFLSGYKTYITAIVGVVAAVGAYLSGEVGLTETIGAAWVALQMVFLRKGVKTDAGS